MTHDIIFRSYDNKIYIWPGKTKFGGMWTINFYFTLRNGFFNDLSDILDKLLFDRLHFLKNIPNWLSKKQNFFMKSEKMIILILNTDMLEWLEAFHHFQKRILLAYFLLRCSWCARCRWLQPIRTYITIRY